MKPILTLINLCCLLISVNSIGQGNLTREEKMEDFETLYSELKSSYPYFEVNKRQNKVDWLSNKQKYQGLIEQSATDKEFVEAINSILNDLHNGHTDTYPTIIYDYFYDAYKGALDSYPSLQPYVSELEKTSVEKCSYWSKLMLENETVSKELDEQDAAVVDNENIRTQYDDSLSVAMLSISSFSYDKIEMDKQQLSDFFGGIHNYENLIIDIRGNTGGDDTYWQEYIIPYLIDKTIQYPVVFGFKTSERLLNFKPKYIENANRDDFNFANLPEELEGKDFAFYSGNISISPYNESRVYQGKIYLLVDNLVYSSAESLAYFCKATQFAEIFGERTGGDGIGTDPLLLTLPNSGIVIRFTGEMALNPDGSSNEEMKTEPDFELHQSINSIDIKTIFKEILAIKIQLN